MHPAAPPADGEPVGVVLAGGAGRRIGGDKATVTLNGRPLLHYPLRALRGVVHDVAIVAKRTTQLPMVAGIADVWIEPETPRHPLTGVVHALHMAGGRPVLVVAVDLPLLRPDVLRTILDAGRDGTAAVVPRVGERLQPLCALYSPRALPVLARFGPDERIQDVIGRLGVREVALPDDGAFLNVNGFEDLFAATMALSRR